MARLYFFFLLVCVQAMAFAQGQSPLLERAFLKDPRGQMSVDEAAASQFRPYEGSLGLGFQPGAVWTRLQIDKASDPGEAASRRLMVRVGPNYLERIELYTPSGAGWNRQVQGALVPVVTRECPDDMHCFFVDVPASEVSKVYLRFAHRGFLVAQVDVLTLDAVPFAVAKRVRGITGSMAVALSLLVVGIVLLVADRSLLLFAYCCFQLTVVLFIASNAGLLGSLFPGLPVTLLNTFNGLIYVLRVAMTGFLAWAVLRPHRPSPVFLDGAKVMLVGCVIFGLFILAGQMQLGLMGSLLVFSAIPFLQLFGILSAKDLPAPQRWILIAGTLLYIVMLTLGLWLNFTDQPLMPRVGMVKQIVDWRLNGFAVGVLFFWITMLERAAQKRAREKEVDALRHQAVEAKTRQAELDERSALIDMLTHELKNPLGTIRFALASLRQQAAGNRDALTRIHSIDTSARRMDDLIERVANSSKIERTLPTDTPAVLDAGSFIQELLHDMPDPDQWEVRVQPGATFCCDRQLLWVILENLMTNASKYSLPGHAIHIDVTREEGATPGPGEALGSLAIGRRARFEISNRVDRAWVPEEAALFDRYYRHPNVQNKAGMGLGLSVVKSAVQKIGGEVAYRHEHERVFFTLQVPA